MVVDQDGERVGRRFAEQGDLEDIACRCPVGAGHDDGTRAGGESVPALTAVEESDVDAAGVRGVVVDDPVIQLSQRRVVQQFPQDIAVLHFRESQYIRHVALPLSDPEQGLRDRPAFGLEAFFRPAALAQGGEFRIRRAQAVVVVVEVILEVPKKDPGLLRPGTAGDTQKSDNQHHPSHTRKGRRLKRNCQ